MKKRIRLPRWLLITIGVISVVLGTLGIFLPLLPTTPFLLLAAACFTRASRKLYCWLITHPWFGAYIRNYREHRAITLQTKIVSLSLLWLTIGYSVVAVIDILAVRILLVGIAVGVTTHLVRLKNLTREMLEENQVPRSRHVARRECELAEGRR